MQAIIREMEEADIDSIRAIEAQSFSTPWSRELLLRELENPIGHNWVLETDDSVIGYLFYWMVVGEVHLLNIAIHPDYRQRGLARFLMHHMIMHAKESEMKVIFLEVRENNKEARRLYESFRFVDVGRIKNYYPEDKQDAIIMRRDL